MTRLQMLFIGLTTGDESPHFICPPKADYEPCECGDYTAGADGSISLYCDNQNLGDSKISDILDRFLMKKGEISPLGDLQLRANQLSRVPKQIQHFKRLDNVNLASNKITTVESGDFNFNATLK